MRMNDYECRTCGMVFTAPVTTDGPRPSCPDCKTNIYVSWRPTVISVRKIGEGWTERFYGKEDGDE